MSKMSNLAIDQENEKRQSGHIEDKTPFEVVEEIDSFIFNEIIK